MQSNINNTSCSVTCVFPSLVETLHICTCLHANKLKANVASSQYPTGVHNAMSMKLMPNLLSVKFSDGCSRPRLDLVLPFIECQTPRTA